ncbi:MAG: N-acetylglucosamine-6-phosphate deacetylase [Candidatus Gastranaerophilales bacterium]|nr:N-acetylglucosamine-6-phosphate deacetylase [Candidatus Gastranaerophilales bacterium]
MNEELKQFLSFFNLSANTDSDGLLLIINGQVQNPGQVLKQENILILKDKIIVKSSDLPDKIPENIKTIDARDKVITPGLIDQHIHGGYGCDFNVSSVDEMIDLSKKLAEHGITSIVPTVMTASVDVLNTQMAKITEAKKNKPDNSVKFLGIHLEGPFLCPKYKGIHPENEILIPSVENFKLIENQEIKIVTYSPDLDKDLELTKYLAEKNIIPSAGHTDADIEQIKKAYKAGLKQFTHLFNAMTPLHHRNPGIIGEALTNDNLYVEVIADGMHLHPVIVDIVLRTKPASKVIFISDSLPLNNAQEDSVIFGGQRIFRKEGKAVNSYGTFAGSLIFLDAALNNLVEWKLANLSEFLMFASFNVANNLGQDELSFIDKGKTADIVIWNRDNDSYKVDTTIINGKIAFNCL